MYRSLAPDSVRTTRFVFGALLVSAIAFGGFFISSAHAAITTINLVSPNGGEEWRGTQSISWSGVSDNTLDSIDITYAADGTNFNQLVTQGILFSAGSFSWDTSSFVESSGARIHISPSGFPLLGDSSTGTFTVDNTAPVTTATPSFAPAPTGWYNISTGVPTITLACADGAVGSGCNDTYYAWDSGAPALYSSPLTPPEGIHTLSFYSDDQATDALGARNVESPNTLEVKVDTSAPAAPTVVLTDPVNATNQASVLITGTGEANASLDFSIDDTNAGTPAVSNTGGVDGAGSISISGVDVSSLDDDTLTLSVVLTDAAGNTGPAGTDTATKDTVAIISSIASDATAAGVLKVGDTITFTMAPSMSEPGSSVSGSYNGQALLWSDDGLGASYSATYTVAEGDADQASPLQISGVTFTDSAGNVSAPADGTDVVKTVDANSPTLSPVSISSDNSNPAWATAGDTVTLSFTSNESIDTPTVLIDGMSAIVANTAGNDWTAAYTFAGGETEGIIPFSIAFADTAGNAGTAVSATTDSSGVTYDETPPLTPSITTIAGDGYINNSEKGGVHVVGTAEDGSTVSVTLTDSVLTSVTGTGTAAGGVFDIVLDGTTLLDGAITSSATATDAAGNESPADTAATATKDIVAPTASSITTKDADADGSVDTATIVFSEDMKDSSFSTDAFSIGGASGTIVTSGVPDDGTVDISHAGVAGTETKDVTYVPGAVTDLAGNPLAAVASGSVSEVDAAGPVPMSARTTDTTHITVTFSEDLNGSSDSPADFSIAGNSVTATAELAGVITLTLGTPLGTGDTPQVTVHGNGSSLGLKDLNDNWSPAEYTLTAVDGVAPTLSGVTVSSDNDADTAAPEWAKVGDTATLSFTASEPIASPTVLIDGMSATVANTAGNDWTATYTFAGGEAGGTIPFSIVFEDLAAPAHNAGTTVTATGDSSSVFFDEAAPAVNAGTDKEVNALTAQDATTSDPAPASGIAAYSWTTISGPGAITFGTPTSEDTTISADTDGTYVLSLAVTDNAGNSASDTMTLVWDTTNPEPLTSSPSDGMTGVAVAAGTASVTYDEDIVLLDSSRVLLVNDATGASYKGAVEVSGGNGNSAILNIGYSGLEYGTTYRINVKSNAVEDVAGNNAELSIISYFTTIIDTQPPTIQSLSASGIGETSAALSAVTNENAACRYAATDSAYESMAPMGTTGGTSHSQDITGLAAGTGYTFFVRCQDASGNAMTTSGIASFTTSAPAPDTDAPPAPSIATAPATVNADSYAISGAAGADTPAPGTRTISVYNGAMLAGTAVVPTGQTGWSVLVPLNQNAENSFTAVSTDAAGNSSAASEAVVIVEDETAGADTAAPDVPEIATADATIDADTYEIAGTLADDDGVRTLTLFKDGIVVGTAVLPAGQTDWAITVSLVQNTDNVFTASATDEAGNASGESDAVTITEAIDDTAALAVTGIDAARSFASADNTFGNGWKWTFHITVPTGETSFAMKFADFVSGANSIPAAANIRFYSAQSSDAFDADSAIVAAAAGEYGSAMTLSADLDADTAGRQIEVTVEAKVPESTPGGSYSTSYGVRSEPSL